MSLLGLDDDSKLVREVRLRLYKGDVKGALARVDSALQGQEEVSEAYRLRAYIREFHLKDYDGALADLTESIKLRPDDFRAYVTRSKIRERFKKDFIRALQDIDFAEKAGLAPGRSSSYRAVLKKELKDYRGAIAEYEKSLVFEPTSTSNAIELTWLIMGLDGIPAGATRLDRFLSNYKQVRGEKIPRVVGEKVLKNSKLLTHKNASGGKESVPVNRHTTMDFVANSKRELDARLEENEEGKKLSEAYCLLGSVYLKIGESQKAFENLSIAIDIHRNQDDAYGLRAIYHLERGEYDLAIEDLDRSIDIVDLPIYYLNRGISYILKGDEKRGQNDLKNYLKLFPEGKPTFDKEISDLKSKYSRK